MIPIRIDGEYNTAKVFTQPDSIEDYATAQIKMICDQPVVESYKDIVVMPDVHPGKIGPIGLVMHGRSESPILPGLIGPDIGCGITMFPIKGDMDFQKLDRVINAYIPSGTAIRKKPSRFVSSANAYNWIGTLGGGNHFIEIDKDDIGQYYLIIHSGSRGAGAAAYKKYMDKGHKELKEKEIPYELTYLTGDLKEEYMNDVEELSRLAYINRDTIGREIISEMKWKYNGNTIDTIHNFLEFDNTGEFILRKGAQSAYLDQDILIPISMAEGTLLCKGKDNSKWLCSAPHGSGRVMSRSDVSKTYTLKNFKESMKDVYSPSISRKTLDECPMAYRGKEYIEEAIKDTAIVIRHFKPVYNFKAGGE